MRMRLPWPENSLQGRRGRSSEPLAAVSSRPRTLSDNIGRRQIIGYFLRVDFLANGASASRLWRRYLILGYHVLPAFATPILGTAFGATLGGARFLPSLAGSAVGLGVVLGMFATGLVVDPDDNFLAFITIPATVQAGITTWIASAFD